MIIRSKVLNFELYRQYRAVSSSGQNEEHDGEKDETAVLVGRRRHDREESCMWRDTKKRSVGQNAVGGRSSLRRAKHCRGRVLAPSGETR